MRIGTFRWLVVIGMSLLVAAACSRSAPQTESALRPVATIKDIMDSMVDPAADFIWDSVETTITAAGAVDKEPRTPEEWAMVRRNAVTLVEATNLLVMDGRHIAKPGEAPENQEVELRPDQIETLVNQDRAAWVKFAHALHAAGMEALTATDAKSVPGLLDAGEKIDNACEQCHLKYWYPNSKQAADAKGKS